MTESVILSRHLTLETIEVEAFDALDGQGKPSYDTSVDVNARVVLQDRLLDQTDGSQIKTELTAWVPSGEDVMPGEQDRITYDSVSYIVVQQKNVKHRDSSASHRRIRCRRE